MKTLCDILDRVAADRRSELLYVRPAGADSFEAWSAADLLEQVDRCANGLRDLGIGRGGRVGLISDNRPEWHVVDFACHRLGATLVPLFPTLAAAQVADCLRRSACTVLVVDTAEQAVKVASIRGDLPQIESVVTLDPVGDQKIDTPVVSWDEFLPADGGGADFDGPEGADSIATIIFTSGTSGPPKGVMLTHANFVANLEGVLDRSPAVASDVGLSLLPLSHVYERTLDYCYLAAGGRIAYSKPSEVATDFKLVRPTVMVGVPRLYEKLRQAIEERVEGSRLYALALQVGLRRARASTGEPEGLLNSLLHPIMERLVLRKIREATGGRMRLMSAGGAALDAELNWWYAAMGWELLQGYGLTESAPIISTNAPGDNRIGTVGRPLDNVEVRLADDNEIVARGPNIMHGYLDDAAATAEVLRDGWLFTGDVGSIEPGGYLRITGRKKAILVTSTGKNVAPQAVELAISASPWVEQLLVVGNDRRFISALIVPAFSRLEPWAAERGLGTDRAALCVSEEVRELFAGELKRLQVDLARYERARAFRLVESPFTVANGQLTPTLKTVRRKVEQDFADLIEEMYVH